MSEEQIQQNEHQEHSCTCKKLLVLVIVSLLLSIASFTDVLNSLDFIPTSFFSSADISFIFGNIVIASPPFCTRESRL